MLFCKLYTSTLILQPTMRSKGMWRWGNMYTIIITEFVWRWQLRLSWASSEEQWASSLDSPSSVGLRSSTTSSGSFLLDLVKSKPSIKVNSTFVQFLIPTYCIKHHFSFNEIWSCDFCPDIWSRVPNYKKSFLWCLAEIDFFHVCSGHIYLNSFRQDSISKTFIL